MSMTLREVLILAERCFQDRGCSDCRRDAELLLCYYLERDRLYLMTHFNDSMDESRCNGFFELMDKRASGIPVQYIIGETEFMGLPFNVDERVLIPRQDTETLVERVLDHYKEKKAPLGGFEGLDLCTGSGCIAISLAKLWPSGKVKLTASDLSPEALAVATGNAKRNGADKHIHFLQGDLFGPLPLNRKGIGKKQFDFIVSNPPYIPSEVIETLQTEVKDHEPRMALDGGVSGLDFYRIILQEAPKHLKDGGLLAMEIGHDQGNSLQFLAEDSKLWKDVKILPDLAGKDRIFWAEKA
ncbi:MAG: peptide chain release factor N(5)-glutamine methyltransferase [Clostridiales bacterium]|nr:peptide chain release factor N(5)-glutamine methyltransferase [Clostridiales bacterium]